MKRTRKNFNLENLLNKPSTLFHSGTQKIIYQVYTDSKYIHAPYLLLQPISKED